MIPDRACGACRSACTSCRWSVPDLSMIAIVGSSSCVSAGTITRAQNSVTTYSMPTFAAVSAALAVIAIPPFLYRLICLIPDSEPALQPEQQCQRDPRRSEQQGGYAPTPGRPSDRRLRLLMVDRHLDQYLVLRHAVVTVLRIPAILVRIDRAIVR